MDRVIRKGVGLALAVSLAGAWGCEAGAGRGGQALFAIGQAGDVATPLAVPRPGEPIPDDMAPIVAPAPLSRGAGGAGGALLPAAPRVTGEVTVAFHGLLGTAAQRRLLATVADIDHVKVIVTPVGGTPVEQDVNKAQLSAGVTSVTFNGLPAGLAKVTIYAFDAQNNVIGTSTETIAVVGGVTTAVAITVQLNPTYTPQPGGVDTTITFVDGPEVSGIPPGSILGVFKVGVQPEALAFDASGNVWVANFGGDSVTKLASDGKLVGTYNLDANLKVEPSAIQVDPLGRVWVADYLRHRALVLDGATGAPAVPASVVPIGPYPSALAFNALGQLWAANYMTKSVTALQPTGVPLGNFPVGDNPMAIAFGPTGRVWVVNFKGETVSVLQPTGLPAATVKLPVGAEATAIAIDGTGTAWVAMRGLNELCRIGPNAVVVSRIATKDQPSGVAVDQAGNVWVTNHGNDSVSRYSSDGVFLGKTPVGKGPKAIRTDASGYVWVANYLDNTVMKLQP